MTLSKISKVPCLACPYLQGDGVLQYTEEDYKKFIIQLQNGTPKTCYSDPMKATACRGQRNANLQIWYNQGKIDEPTDEALALAFKKNKVPIPDYILPE